MVTRYERVVLELDDRFTTDMARAAAATAVLNKEFDSLSSDSVRTRRSISDIDSQMVALGRTAGGSTRELDRLSGRFRILTDIAAALGPGLIPIAAVGVPAVTGLAASLGFATVAGGTLMLAFQGIGTALKALNKADLEPTTQNLTDAQIALEQLSPAAAAFAREVHELMPALQQLRDASAAGFLPGAADGLRDLETVLPRLEQLVTAVSTELGSIAADTGESLSSDRWEPFLDFLAQEAPAALDDLSKIVGNTGHALAELWMAFQPVNNDFSGFLVESTKDLDRWSTGLKKTEGFRDFVDYIEENGPQVAETFGAIANATVQIVQAASPLGGPVLAGVEAFANAVATIADSDLGTPLFTAAAALGLFNRALAVTASAQKGLTGFGARLDGAGVKTKAFRTNINQVRADLAILASTAGTAGARTERELLRAQAASQRLKSSLAPVGKGAGLLGALAVASTGAADGIGLTNTATLALAGSFGGAPGVAAGGLIGLLLDAKAASKQFSDAMTEANRALQTGDVDKMREKLADLKKQRDDLTDVTGFRDFFGDLGTQLTQDSSFLGLGSSPVEKIDAKSFQLRMQSAFKQVADTATGVNGLIQHGFDATAAGIDTATQSAEDFRNELEKVNEVLTGQANFSAFQESLDALGERMQRRADLMKQLNDANARAAAATTPAERKQATDEIARLNAELKNYKNTLDTTTPAGRANAEILRNIASSAFNYAQSLKDPALRAGFLDNARDQYIKTAEALGATKKRAREMADEVGLLNRVKGHVKIEVDATGAIRIIDEVAERLKRLQQRQAIILNGQLGEIKRGGGRDGDPSTPFAGGGWTGPGAKYDVAGVVHADEYVFSKEATHGNVGFLDLMHKRLRGYADGGYVSRARHPRPVASTVAAPIDYDRLALAMAAMQQPQPLYGDVKLQPHNYSEFVREMEADQQRSAGDGRRRP